MTAALNLHQDENQASTTELVLLSSNPAKIKFNLAEFREGIRTELKKYDVVVTVDTVKDAKALAADLNGQAKSLKDRFKEAAALVTKPVDDLGLEVADIVTEILESREKLTAQIKKFEDERKVTVRTVIEAKRLELWDKLEVQEEFRNADISKLVKLTALTAKDSLTSTTLRDLQPLIENNRRLQDQTEKRLLQLENQSYRAGLKAPLSRAHVESFLFEEESAYVARLSLIIESELKRQKATEDATRRQMAEETERAAPVQQQDDTARLEQSIKQAESALPYAEGSYNEDKRRIDDMKQSLAAKQHVSGVPKLDFILTPCGDVATMVNRMTATPEEAFQAALSASCERTSLIDVWTKDGGRVAIADGDAGRVYVWNQF